MKAIKCDMCGAFETQVATNEDDELEGHSMPYREISFVRVKLLLVIHGKGASSLPHLCRACKCKALHALLEGLEAPDA